MPRLDAPTTPIAALASATTALLVATAWAQPTGDCAPRPPASAPLGSIHADEVTRCITADNVWPRAGDSPWHGVGPAATTFAGHLAMGLSLSYLSRPIVVEVESADPAGTRILVVDNDFGATLALALGLGDRAELTLAAPMTLFQNGSGVSDLVGTSDDELPTSAVGDLRFGTGLAIVQREPRADGPALAARFEAVAPTGTRSAFASAGAAVFVPTVVYDHRLAIGSWGVELGGRLRPVARRFGGSTVQNQLYVGAAGAVEAVEDGWLSVAGELYALVGLTPRDDGAAEGGSLEAPAEWFVSARTAHFLERQLALLLGGGGWLPMGAAAPLTTPRFRVGLTVEYSWQPPAE